MGAMQKKVFFTAGGSLKPGQGMNYVLYLIIGSVQNEISIAENIRLIKDLAS